ncbi:hypothetical protein Lal_00045750 [Lupinus albus]|nr:hypothetical protein Lal_00045750 [Lupinus albus]
MATSRNGDSYSQILKSPKKPVSSDAPSPLSIDCASKLHPNCGTQIFYGVFYGNETVSADCCYNLVHDLGKICHDSMTSYALITWLKFKPEETQILQRKDQIWNNCKSNN